MLIVGGYMFYTLTKERAELQAEVDTQKDKVTKLNHYIDLKKKLEKEIEESTTKHNEKIKEIEDKYQVEITSLTKKLDDSQNVVKDLEAEIDTEKSKKIIWQKISIH